MKSLGIHFEDNIICDCRIINKCLKLFRSIFLCVFLVLVSLLYFALYGVTVCLIICTFPILWMYIIFLSPYHLIYYVIINIPDVCSIVIGCLSILYDEYTRYGSSRRFCIYHPSDCNHYSWVRKQKILPIIPSPLCV